MDIRTVFVPFPVLDTPRLILRALRMDDLDDLYRYASDPAIDQHTPWAHYQSVEEARQDLARYVMQYTAEDMGVWGIERRADGRLIGICNFSYWYPPDRRAEIGYTIARDAWGHGLATEAAQALISFGFQHMNLARIEAICTPDNRASERVLQKVGMQFEGLLRSYQIWRGKPQDLKMYAIISTDRQPQLP